MFAHLLTTVAKLLGAGGAKAIVADSLLMKQQLLIINRSRRRASSSTCDVWSIAICVKAYADAVRVAFAGLFVILRQRDTE